MNWEGIKKEEDLEDTGWYVQEYYILYDNDIL